LPPLLTPSLSSSSQERDLVRLYIQLPIQVRPGERADKSQFTPDFILETARKVLHPYTLETEHIEWYTGYHINQRLTNSFGVHNRVFLAGDACHTHSRASRSLFFLCLSASSSLTALRRSQPKPGRA